MERRESSVRRSRTDLRRCVLALQGDHLWTFTKRGRFTTREDARATWRRFERSYGRFIGGYVAVIEPHELGGYHIHVAVHGFRAVHVVRVGWARALGGTGQERGSDTLGNVDVRDRRSASPRRTAGYLAKYLGKEALAPGSKSYTSSHGLAPSSVRRFVVPVDLSHPPQERARALLEELFQRDFESSATWWVGGTSGFTCWAEDTPEPLAE